MLPPTPNLEERDHGHARELDERPVGHGLLGLNLHFTKVVDDEGHMHLLVKTVAQCYFLSIWAVHRS